MLLPNAVSTGKVAALAAANTTLAASAGAIAAVFANLYIKERQTGESHFDLMAAMNGCLSGLVAVTAGCATIEYWAAVVIGAVAGCLYLAGSAALIHYKLDDAVDAVPVHLVNGAWGLLSTGLFSSPGRIQDAFGANFTHAGLFYTFKSGVDFTLLASQTLEIVFIAGWAVATMTPFFLWLNYMGWFRSDSLEELVGLDISYHGGYQKEEEFVQEEFVKAFKDQKLRQRRPTLQGQPATTEPMDEDSMSWMDFSISSQQEQAPSSPKRGTDSKSKALRISSKDKKKNRLPEAMINV